VVLGRLLPQSFLGGNMQLDKGAAIDALKNIAEPLALSVEQAAEGIIDVVNDHMVRALRVMSVERGEDPKDFTLVSFGGAGGLHVCALAEELEMTNALVPVNAGVLSALGMLAAEASRERSRTINKRIKDCKTENIEKIFSELMDHAIKELDSNGCNDNIKTKLTVDVRYQGQSNALNLTWSGLKNIEEAFHQKHKDSYGHDLDIGIELVNVRVRATEQRQAFELPKWAPWKELIEESTTMPGIDEPVLVINRSGLKIAQQVKGPALITETSSTTWLAKGWSAEVDSVGNLRLIKL
jgi:N-methylhydantoinase A